MGSSRSALALKAAVALVCAYETESIVTGRTPTVSTLCGRHRWLTPLILGGLALHLTGNRTRIPKTRS